MSVGMSSQPAPFKAVNYSDNEKSFGKEFKTKNDEDFIELCNSIGISRDLPG